ncbi:OTU-like cysteine protease [Trifolium medium]|uniref:OTU-like cysteine protease n=1 Tax=Trifolium medium TaxID=97028 RepID=A0A392MED7_9FABA|nr:OTU-like cysteine protease [Trifolium medium]
MDSLHPDTPQSQSSSQKNAREKNQSPTLAPGPPRRKWSAEVHQLSQFIHEYFADVIDVSGDGHCGFHVVSHLLGRSDEAHHIIRLDLTIELNQNKARY